MLETIQEALGRRARRGLWSSKPADERLFVAALVTAVALGIGVRAFHIFHSDFPLNDGGLFYQMVRDIQQASYGLPVTTTYNNAHIPFGYPPLGLYLAAILDDLTPFSLVTVFRLVPLAATSLSIVAFVLLAKRLLVSRLALVVAVVAFALAPRSFIWLLMGGGVTRSLGFLFALLALHQLHRVYSEHGGRSAALAALFGALTVLSHLETGFFLAFSGAVMFIFYGRHRYGLVATAAIGGAVVVLTAPWWVTVLAQHGPGPLLDAQRSGDSVFSNAASRQYVALSLARGISTSEPYFPLIGALGLLGGLTAIFTRRFFLPAWWVTTIVLDPRAFPTFTTAPVAMLAGIGVAEFVLPALAHLRGRPREPNGHRNGELVRGIRHWVREPAAWLLGTGLIFAAAGSLITAPGLGGEGVYLRGLSHDSRDAFAWIAAATPADSRVLVIPRGSWQTDKESEWFPVLAARKSVATVQGYEWTPAFHEREDYYGDAWTCGFRTADCLDDWAAETGVTFTHVFIPREDGGQCCTTLTTSLALDSRYVLLLDAPGGTLYVRIAPFPSTIRTAARQE